jgi:hypothetical protein
MNENLKYLASGEDEIEASPISSRDEAKEYTNTTKVLIDLPDKTLRDLEYLASLKEITRTQVLTECIATTKRLVEIAPNGARIEPLKFWDRIFIKLFDYRDRTD